MIEQLYLELPEAYWFNPSLIQLPTYKLFRAGVRDSWRLYYTVADDISFYVGATTACNFYYPKDEVFQDWYRNHQNPKQYVRERAEIGTAEHILFPLFLKTGNITYEYVKQYVECMINTGEAPRPELDNVPLNSNLRSLNIEKTTTEVYKALLSFAQFLVDYKVQPIACEIGLKSEVGIGTYIDFVCKMTVEETGFFGETYKVGGKNNPKGSPKESKRPREVIALIDFKSGTWDGEAHDGQLFLNKIVWEENYPAIKIDKLFNWHPKDFKTEPTYQLLEKDFDGEEADLICRKAAKRKTKMIKQETVSEFDDTIIAGQAPRTLKYLSLKDKILKLHNDTYAKLESDFYQENIVETV